MLIAMVILTKVDSAHPYEHRLTHDIDVWMAGAQWLAPRAKAEKNQTYCSKLVRSSQATPPETVMAAPRHRVETR